jgi:hypothetical protein
MSALDASLVPVTFKTNYMNAALPICAVLKFLPPPLPQICIGFQLHHASESMVAFSMAFILFRVLN